MKKFLTYFFLVINLSFFAQQKVKIHITFTNSYCGGARPTPEIEAASNTPKNLSSFNLILAPKKSFKANADSVVIAIKTDSKKIKTDSTGAFSISLKPGKYALYLTKKKNENISTNYFPGCAKMLVTEYAEILIEKGKTNYQLNLHFPCNPCETHNKP